MSEFRQYKPEQAAEEAAELKNIMEDGNVADYAQAESVLNRRKFQNNLDQTGQDIQKVAQDENQTYDEWLAGLHRGEYMKVLDSYAVRWNMEKAARDILQNFYDAEGGTLDGVKIIVTEEGEGEDKQYRVRIEGNGSYDFRKLLHYGGTSKENDPTTAGGFGEGAKISSLVLLRDFDFSDVKYGSGDWELDFYLAEAPVGTYDQQSQGLFARLEDREQPVDGSFTELVTRSKDAADAIQSARELFYSSENPDFQNPTYEVEEDGKKVGGFKFLGMDPNGRLLPGHFYDVGQRRHYEKTDEWETVGGVNIWSWVKTFGEDRDRGAVTREELRDRVIKPLVDNIPADKLSDLVYQLESAWVSSVSFITPTYELLYAMTERLAKANVKLNFDDKYLASSLGTPFSVIQLLGQDHTICHSFLSKVGMKTTNEKFTELQKHFQTEPSPEQQAKIGLLKQATTLLVETNPKLTNVAPNKDIWLYSRENEKSIFNGQYDEQFVWLAEELLNDRFEKALTTYYHELCHAHGSDQSADFSYAMTGAMEEVMVAITSSTETFQKFQKLKSEWGGQHGGATEGVEPETPASDSKPIVQEVEPKPARRIWPFPRRKS